MTDKDFVNTQHGDDSFRISRSKVDRKFIDDGLSNGSGVITGLEITKTEGPIDGDESIDAMLTALGI